MNQTQVFAAATASLALSAAWILGIGTVFAQTQSVQVPKFQYDPTFP